MRVLMVATLLALLTWTVQSRAQEAPDMRLVVDVSGSMKQNDPGRLSRSALELMVTLLPSGARSGLWTFGSEVANPLPSTTVNEAWRQRALALQSALSAYQQFTDIEQAVQAAAEAAPASTERHLVLLTDGVVDVPARGGNKRAEDAASRRRLLEELTPELAEEGVVIHTIAFSPDVDLSLVEQMAQMTGGLATVAETPDALLRAFLDVFDRIFPVDQVPLEAGGFTIDERIDTFSALLFHEPESSPLALVGPDGQRYTAEQHPDEVRWQAQERFDVITIPNPAAGEWRIEGQFGEDSRVNIESSLALRTSELPTTLYMGFETPLEAWVERQGESRLSNDAEGLSLRAELQDGTGKVVESVAMQHEGERFQGVLPAPEFSGNGRLSVMAESPGFVRQRQLAINVLPAVSAEVNEGAGRVALQAEHPRLSTNNTRIEAQLQGDELGVEPGGGRDWLVRLPELDPNIAVPLQLTATVTLDGESRILELPPLQLNGDAPTGLGSFKRDRQALSGERMSDEVATGQAPESAVADTFSETLSRIANVLPSTAQAFLTSVQRYPLGWAVIAIMILAVVLLLRRLNASRRRRRRRKEPRV